MRSSAETIYHLYFQPKEEHIVKIKSYDDFFDINPLSSVRLCADIDFQNRGGIKNQLIDTNGDGYFEGCFFNPDHHVIKNWDMDDPRNGWNSIMFSYVQNALFDSLIFENISYRSMNHSKSNFGLIARYSYNSHFNNILVRNLNFEILGGTVGGLVSSSVHDDFTNCDIEGAITNHGDSGQIYCNNQIGALAATQFSIDLDHIYPWTHNDSFRSDFVRLYPYDDYPHEEAIKIQEWEISNYQNKTILKSNHVKVNLENPTYCAGGLFGCSDINAFDDSNTVNGHIKSYHAGKYRGGSSLQWRFFDKGNFKPEPGKTEEINLPE